MLLVQKDKTESILILTSEGGAGHKEAAADSERKCIEQERNKVKINKVFVLPDPSSNTQSWMRCFGIDFGKKGVGDWNAAQKNGDMQKIKTIVAAQWISEILFGGNFSTNTFLELTKDQNTKQVIDTQAINSDKIVKSVEEFNRIRSDQKCTERYNKIVRFNNLLRTMPLMSLMAIAKYRHEIQYAPDKEPIKIKKRMTDLPNRAEHFYLSINRISKEDLTNFELEVPHAPMIKNKCDMMAQNERRHFDLEYYRNKCPNLFDAQGTPLVNFEFTDGPIKKEFLNYKEYHIDKNIDLSVNIKIASPEEMIMLKESGAVNFEVTVNLANKFQYNIVAQATVKTIMLGSQAAVEATLHYVDTEIALHHLSKDEAPQYLFVFCGKHDGPNSLFSKLNEKLYNSKKSGMLHKSFKIVPLTYQDADMIAPLYSRADEVFIRSGGISCMEIEVASQGKVYIHSEQKGQNFSQQALLEAMLYWEQGNTEHVMQVLGVDENGLQRVQVTTPEIYRNMKLKQNAKLDCSATATCIRGQVYR